jgi:hypothetical protein
MDQQSPKQPPTEGKAWSREQFKTPPVVMRRFATQLDVSREIFEERALALVEEIQREGKFGERLMKEHWDFRLEIQGTTPRPKVRLTHAPVLIRPAQGAEPKTSLEFFPPVDAEPAKISIEQDHNDASASRFENLDRECHAWLPRIMDRFGTTQIGGFLLEYRNEILRERYPVFWEGEKTLILGKLLWLFRQNRGPVNFVTPISVEFNSASPSRDHASIRFHMETMPKKKREFGLAVTLAYNSLGRKEKQSTDKLFDELREAHGLLFENFVRQFATEALEAFSQ